ncbi:hypothetical protein Q3G72_013788 [Acer saccharum]|nr:hypothetical protein Q3G72_013788 [Acer saccharum]
MGNTKSSNCRLSTKTLSFHKDKEVNMKEFEQYIRNLGLVSYISSIAIDQEKQMVTVNGKFDSESETYMKIASHCLVPTAKSLVPLLHLCELLVERVR